MGLLDPTGTVAAFSQRQIPQLRLWIEAYESTAPSDNISECDKTFTGWRLRIGIGTRKWNQILIYKQKSIVWVDSE